MYTPLHQTAYLVIQRQEITIGFLSNSVLQASVAEVVANLTEKKDHKRLYHELSNTFGHGYGTNIYATVSALGFEGRFLTLVLALVHFFFVLAFSILCCLRVNNLILSSWTLVFTPLWILDAMYYESLLSLLVFSDGKLYMLCKNLLLFIMQAVAGGLLRDQMLVNESVNAGTFQTEDIQTERQLLFKVMVRKTGLTLLRTV
ncbi:unnamed protein product [Peronospora destructor]|uniref:Uncharacterized protein n=1 Tax=Peronospora destructor TaxID=86335 RepID=A0AAV0UW09_9STRA|nr:unnamed protein product [Peronospora destructor]